MGTGERSRWPVGHCVSLKVVPSRRLHLGVLPDKVEAKSLRRYAAEEKVPASQSPTIISLKEREKMLESLAGYANGWAEVLENEGTSRSLGWLFGSREHKSPS